MLTSPLISDAPVLFSIVTSSCEISTTSLVSPEPEASGMAYVSKRAPLSIRRDYRSGAAVAVPSVTRMSDSSALIGVSLVLSVTLCPR